jgi:hypothetical protein
LNEDFRDVLTALIHAGARFLVVGAHALAVHGVPRATGDLDIWIEATATNAQSVWRALLEFGAPVESLDVTAEDLARPGLVVQIGLPPRRIDLLTDISGVDFDSAWESRIVHTLFDVPVPFIGREALVQNKRSARRLKDLADLEALGEGLG